MAEVWGQSPQGLALDPKREVITMHDLHIHTTLSACCADPEAEPAGYLALAREQGLTAVGFVNHVWDSRIPGASPWYAPQTFERAMSIREQIPADTFGIRVLVGVETEFAQGIIALSPECAQQLDYVLVPHSHIHMEGLVRPAGVTASRDIARFLADTFDDLVSRDFATIVAHPFCPLSFDSREQLPEIFSCLSDSRLEQSFGLAAEHGAGVEINLAIFRYGAEDPLYDDTYYRMFRIARKMGCRFSFGSDSHSLAELDRLSAQKRVGELLGLTEADLVSIAR